MTRQTRTNKTLEPIRASSGVCGFVAFLQALMAQLCRSTKVRKLLAVPLMALFLGGCTTTVSMVVDARPTLMPQQLSAQLSERYGELGLEHYSSGLRSHFELGEWHLSPGGGFVGHGVRKGALWIWIAPAAGGDNNAPIIRQKIERLVGQIAPAAAVRVHEARTPDFR